jgi:MFS transporter, DHA1 family, tetracycline resistance protein
MHMDEQNGIATVTDVVPARSATAPMSKSDKSALMTVFLVVFIDLLGFGIVLPLIPRYADEYIPAGASGFVHGIVIGILMSSFSAMQFFFAPIWGRISDRVGRRPILLIGLAGSVVSYALFGVVSEPEVAGGWLAIWLILATRIGAGISGANISTASAVIADCTPKEKRSHGMALIGAAFGIGFTFGPLIAWAGVEFFPDRRGGPGYIAAFLSLIALLVCYRKMPETLPPGGTQTRRSWIDMKGLFDTLKTPTVGLLVFAFFLTVFGFANFEGTVSLLTKRVFEFSDQRNYLIFAYIGFVLMLTQGLIYRRLVKKLDEVKLMRIGITAMFLGLGGLALLTAFADNPTVADYRLGALLLAMAVCVFGFAFLNPSLNGLISKRSDPHRQGEILGINQSFSALARILGPTVGMVLFSVEASHVLPYTVAAVMLAIVLGLLTKVKAA